MESLQTEFAKSLRLRRAIMRRVWYTFVLSIILRPALLLGAVFGGSAIAFWKLVSITSIIENTLRIELGHLPTFVSTALWQADTAALIAFLGLCFVGGIILVRLISGLSVSHSVPATH